MIDKAGQRSKSVGLLIHRLRGFAHDEPFYALANRQVTFDHPVSMPLTPARTASGWEVTLA